MIGATAAAPQQCLRVVEVPHTTPDMIEFQPSMPSSGMFTGFLYCAVHTPYICTVGGVPHATHLLLTVANVSAASAATGINRDKQVTHVVQYVTQC